MSTILRFSVLGVFGAVLACSGADDSSDPSISASGVEARIVGGAAFSGLPGVGSITYQGESYCTGTLISSTRVVTAAHCLSDYSPSSFKFAIGANASSPEKTYSIVGGAQHPDWDSDTLLGDIAYLTLSKDADETPLKVLNSMDSSWIGADLTFVGYGMDDGERQSGNGVKRSVIMPISELSGTQFAYQTAGKNTCNGDSGGPAFFIDQNGTYLLAGTTSYGDTYCTDYGVDTIVPSYISWLGVTGTAPNEETETDSEEEDDEEETSNGNCGTETFEGRCSGETVIWCENDAVYQVDCAVRNKVCAFSSVEDYYGCMETETDTETDPCEGETYAGRCDGSTVIWCESETVKSLACGDYGGDCEFDSSRNIYNCLYE